MFYKETALLILALITVKRLVKWNAVTKFIGDAITVIYGGNEHSVG